MNFSYTTSRNLRDGLTVTTVEGLDIPGRNFGLTMTTSKSGRGGISSVAGVAEHKDGFITFDLLGDWRATLATSPARATEKALQALHEKALDSFADALVRATAHTVAKLAKEEAQRAEHREYSADESAALMDNNNYVGHASHY